MIEQSPSGWLARIFSLDLRSLAALRIGLGLFTTGEILHRMVDVRDFYTDEGVLPRSAITGEFANYWALSLNMVSGAIWWQVLLFLICAVAGLALAAGYRTWTANLVCWILVLSVHNRNDVNVDGCDMVHRLLLFWSLFLPLGALWSVDAFRRGATVLPRPWIFNPASAALTLQMASIFFFAALIKTGAPWRKDFTAVWYVLNWEVFVTPAGMWLRQFHDLLRALTIGTMIVEGVFPLLLLVPWAPLRVFALLSFISLHVGFVVTMKLFMFASIMIIGWLSLMPGWFWNKLGVGCEWTEAWRARFGQLSAWLPASGWPGFSPLERWPVAWQRFVLFCLIYVFCWNVRGVLPSVIRVFPAAINPFALILRLDQHWLMFAPTPISENGWFVVPGRLASGRFVDVYRDGEPLSWARPNRIADHYLNRRWRIYLWGITRVDRPAYRKYYASYLCRQWEARHDEVLEGFDIVLMHEKTNADYTVSPPVRLMLFEGAKCH